MLGRAFSANPLFQVSHSLSAGSSQSPPWGFTSMYGTDEVPQTLPALTPRFWFFGNVFGLLTGEGLFTREFG